MLPVAAHTGDTQAVRRLVERAADAYGGIDILVNNAATNPHFGPLLTAEESHWAKILDVNVTGYFRTIQACAPLFKQRGGGCVINMASVAGREYQPGMGIYSVSKAGVIMLTQALAVELAADKIRVNAIAPGFVKTQFSRVLWETPELYERIKTMIPMGRMAYAGGADRYRIVPGIGPRQLHHGGGVLCGWRDSWRGGVCSQRNSR